jgi:uncharacterized protein YjbI with pentapeptide repeats
MLINADLSQANLSNAFLAGNFATFPGDPGDYAVVPGADLSGANLTGANLANANFAGFIYEFSFAYGANFTNANLSGADARGADFLYAVFANTNTSNLIQSDGHVAGLSLTSGDSLVVRDYDVDPGLPVVPNIIVEGQLSMSGTGTLRMEFDADAWDSKISFAPGISVARGGTLELTFVPEVNLATQIGRTIDLFDWNGVTPTGTFHVSSLYTWNLTNLYTTGEVTLTAAPGIVPGDFNGNVVVDAADYTVWRDSLGRTGPNLAADGNFNNQIDSGDYDVWKAHFGQSTGRGAALTSVAPQSAVPEPANLVVLLISVVATLRFRYQPEF